MTYCHQPSHFSQRQTVGKLAASMSTSLFSNISLTFAVRHSITATIPAILLAVLWAEHTMSRKQCFQCRVFRQLYLCWKD